MDVLKLDQVDIDNKRVLIRVDFNVPVKDGKVTSDIRIRAAIPTIKYALSKNAKVILLSHLGRPIEGQVDDVNSLKPVADRLSEILEKPVKFAKEWLNGVDVNSGEVVLCENVRFNVGEKKDDPALSKKMAKLCDVYVMDAFATSHRAQASTHGVGKYAPVACAGFLLSSELEALGKALAKPEKPMVAIVGGAKVSTKLTVLENLCERVDQLIVGGGIANTFLVAAGYPVGASLYEKDLVDNAKHIMQKIKKLGGNLPIPVDVRVAKSFSEDEKDVVKKVDDIAADEMVLDIGPETEKIFSKIIEGAKTILWNGPLGVFEFNGFAAGTRQLSKDIAKSSAFSIAGGGDTIAAIEKFNIQDDVSYISTAGGAFLEFLEGKKLPAIEMLKEKYRS
ncbi:phosphoglycerate kinase [Francisellaceae bacterium]|nr:phosphoglycerate kinase [Francisellaceae bacterium]